MKGFVSSVNKITVSLLFSTFPASPVRKNVHCHIGLALFVKPVLYIALSTLPLALHLLTSCETTSQTVTFHTVTSCFAGSILLVRFWFLYGVFSHRLVAVFFNWKNAQSFLLSCSICSVANTTAYSARKKQCCPCQTGMTSDVASSAAGWQFVPVCATGTTTASFTSEGWVHRELFSSSFLMVSGQFWTKITLL